MPDTEARRDRSARHYLKDGPALTRLQTTVALAARTVRFPAAMVNILDEGTQYTISSLQLPAGPPTPRAAALCDVVVRSGQPLVVHGTDADARFRDYPEVTGRHIRSYAGVPLLGRESLVVGALCVVDSEVREVTAEQLTRLSEFGRIVEDQLDLLRRLSEFRYRGGVATQELARAIREGEIVPWYQPIIELASGRTVGFEALARWQHPGGEITYPGGFVPLAEDSDLIIDLDRSLMRQAFVDLKRWQPTQPDLRISVNLSGRHFDQGDCLTSINEAVAAAGVRAESVDLELTETYQLSPRSIGVQIGQLREAGFSVWLDDFGTGWSALDYLLRLPVDGIKIDRAVSVALGTHVGNAMTRAVTGLASELGLFTIIEGVETVAQAELALILGCSFAQGYLWSAAVPASVIDGMVGSAADGAGFAPPTSFLATTAPTKVSSFGGEGIER